MSDGVVLSGQQFDPNDSLVLAFTEQMLDYSGPDDLRITGVEGETGVEIGPIDRGAAKVRRYDLAAIAAALAEIALKSPFTIPRIDLPDVLTGITVTYNTSSGEGLDSHPAGNMSLVLFGTGSGSLSPSSSAQSSASIIPDIQPEIVTRYLQQVPATLCEFYLPDNSSLATILAKLTTMMEAAVLSWPQFHPVAHTITIKGEQKSIAAKASTQWSGGGSLASGHVGYGWGNGGSFEVAGTIKTVRISPTIHGAITIGSATSATTIDVSANASLPALGVGSPAETLSISNIKTVAATINASVTPTTLAATTPAAIPSSGLYLYELVPGPQKFNHTIYQAKVVNFALL